MNRRPLTLLLGAMCVYSGIARSADSAGELVEANAYTLELRAGKLVGPGAEWLMGKAGAPQCVLLGEPHNSNLVPAFTTALFSMLHDESGDRLLIKGLPWASSRVFLSAKSRPTMRSGCV